MGEVTERKDFDRLLAGAKSWEESKQTAASENADTETLRKIIL